MPATTRASRTSSSGPWIPGRRAVAWATVFAVAMLMGLPIAPRQVVREAHSAVEERPNILVIVTDDQRADGTMGVMPNTLRWFRDQGTRFNPAFVTTPLCCPSRASILSGRDAHNHGVEHNRDADLLDQASTMERALHPAGYLTGLYGKFLNSWDVNKKPPGWDKWSFITHVYPNGYYDGEWNVNGNVKTISQYSTDYIGDKAVSFLSGPAERHDNQPWFLYLATPAPHGPSTPEPKYEEADVGPFDLNPAVDESDRSDKPPYVQNSDVGLAKAKRERKGMLRTLLSVDDLVQRVFDELGALKERRDTLAFFLSDNGYLWKEHGLRQKSAPYLQSIQVPFFMRWPGHVAEGVTDHRAAENVDIAPTVLAAAGLQPIGPQDGRSLLDAWTRDRVLTEYWSNADGGEGTKGIPTWASTWTPVYQYTEYYKASGAVSFREYYDLADDPWQLVNLLRDGDPTNDPTTGPLSSQLAADRACAGGGCP